MTFIPTELRQFVITRANGYCEYCLLHQIFSIYNHEIDHIIAVKHGGKTIESNLALACLSCNRHKGSDFATLDLDTGDVIRLFHPRQQRWSEHFVLNYATIEGVTRTGQATARLLQFNTRKRLLDRQRLIASGNYPRLRG
ncbi:HNH endonuclease signature motif containing protein [Pannus brasiliensis CCIBt3594]|uniref:HNH endonuclease signature motif containing protein n=1 Tax=Pannus brasiliensis CCIBt3594 TaxID=1427578 RepID=A0AAW9QTF2_9CHRO